MTITFELTDTFSGEANYAWVRRGEYSNTGKNPSDTAIIRQAKKWAGLSGVPCRKDTHGDGTLALYPKGRNLVLFIEFEA